MNGRRGHTPLLLILLLPLLQLLIAKPAGVFDPCAAMGAFEDVLDVARQKSDDKASFIR